MYVENTKVHKNVFFFFKLFIQILPEHVELCSVCIRKFWESVSMLGWVKPDLWGLGGES